MEAHEKQYLLNVARESIAAKLGVKPFYPPQPPSDMLRQTRGAFVTLKIGKSLRGCIGNIRATSPLFETVCEMAAASATQDPRFPPMSKRELNDARIEISVLTPMMKIGSTDEIQVGRDGLYIKRGYNAGLLLPQVPVEWGWDRATFLEQTCRKAGLPATAWKDGDTEIFAFTAEVFGEDD